MKERIRVFIVDDHEVVRLGLRRMLELAEDLVVVGEAGSAEEAWAKVPVLAPHVILMDIKMPNVNGLEATRHLKGSGMPGEVIVLSLYDEYLSQAVEAGASGYLVKDLKHGELVEAVRRVARGELVLGTAVTARPELTERAIRHLRDMVRQSRQSKVPPPPGTPDVAPGRSSGGEDISPHPQGPEAGAPPRDRGPLQGQSAAGFPPAAPPGWQNPTDSGVAARTEAVPPPAGLGGSPGKDIPMPRPQETTADQGEAPEAVHPGLAGLNEPSPPQEPAPRVLGQSDATRGGPLPAQHENPETLSYAPSNKADPFEGDVELKVLPPFEASALMELHQWLRSLPHVEVEETVGSWEGGTSIRLLLRRPIPLLKMLAGVRQVLEAREELVKPEGAAQRFLKRRKGPLPASEERRRVMVRLASAMRPQQLPLDWPSKQPGAS